MDDRDVVSTVRDSFAGIRMTVPVEKVTRRTRRLRARRRLIGLAGAAALASVLALIAIGVMPRIPASVGSHTHTARLAAWSVVRQRDGGVMITLRKLDDPAALQRTLRGDGIPVKVVFEGSNIYDSEKVPGCTYLPKLMAPPPGSIPRWPPLVRRIFFGPHYGYPASPYTFWIYRAAIPRGVGVAILVSEGSPRLSNSHPRGVDAFGVNGFAFDLVKANPGCTGS
jgi:hypothetical protein